MSPFANLRSPPEDVVEEIAPIRAAWQAGATRFDARLAGIGGCPHAPGASGNVATEDVACLFASMGVPTGLGPDRLVALRETVAAWRDHGEPPGTPWCAGLPKTMRSSPAAASA